MRTSLTDRYHIFQKTGHNDSKEHESGGYFVTNEYEFIPMYEPYTLLNDLEYGETKTNWQNNLMSLAIGNKITTKQWMIIYNPSTKEFTYEQFTFFDEHRAKTPKPTFIGLDEKNQILTDAHTSGLNSFEDITRKNIYDSFSYFNPTIGSSYLNVEDYVNADGKLDLDLVETLIYGGGNASEIRKNHKNDPNYMKRIDAYKFYGKGDDGGRSEWNYLFILYSLKLFYNRELILHPYVVGL